MSEQNKADFRRMIEEVFAQGKVDLIDELVDPNMVDHNPTPGQEPGSEGLRRASRSSSSCSGAPFQT